MAEYRLERIIGRNPDKTLRALRRVGVAGFHPRTEATTSSGRNTLCNVRLGVFLRIPYDEITLAHIYEACNEHLTDSSTATPPGLAIVQELISLEIRIELTRYKVADILACLDIPVVGLS